jgi:hypothetical protein
MSDSCILALQFPRRTPLKTVGYTKSYLACRGGYLVPIWQPAIGTSFHSWKAPARPLVLVPHSIQDHTDELPVVYPTALGLSFCSTHWPFSSHKLFSSRSLNCSLTIGKKWTSSEEKSRRCRAAAAVTSDTSSTPHLQKHQYAMTNRSCYTQKVILDLESKRW